MGVIVPLDSEHTDEIAGVDKYDSGIGFAIPMEHIQQVLPRLKKGEDLYPGQAGITLKGPNPSTSEPIIVVCRPKGPMSAAGIKSGDRIVEIDGRVTARAADAREELGRHYAGDTIRVTALRGKQRIEREVKLAAKIEPFQQGFLGILPMRSAEEKGVTVRYVYSKSPAAAAGIAAGDVLVSLGGEPIENREKLIEKMSLFEPGGTVEFEVSRAGAVRKLKATLVTLPEGLPPEALSPGEVPPAKDAGKAADAAGPKVGEVPLKLAEFENEVWAYVPETYTADVPYGVVVWLHAPNDYVEWKELLSRWKPLCDRHDLILVAPKSSEPSRWAPTEAALVDAALKEITSTYHVDPARIVLHGDKGGGSLAFFTAFQNREMIRGVAAVEAAFGGPPPENEPLHRLAIYMAVASKSQAAKAVEQATNAMRQMKYPVTVKKLGEEPRYLTDAELAELVRWIDTLDRI
jgi:serine protease Do